MSIETFTRYFMNRNDIEWGDVRTLEVVEFQNKFTPEIQKHLKKAEVPFTIYELDQLTAKLWRKLRG